jgi:hypothetical protein
MYRDGWSVHCLAEDAKTVVGRPLTMTEDSTLLRLFRFIGATEDDIREIERDIGRRGRGSVWLEVTERGMKMFGLFMP